MRSTKARELPGEDVVTKALMRNRGDLIRSAGDLGVRPSELVDWLRSVPALQAVWMSMEQVKADADFEAATQSQFEAEIRARTQAYRLDGLEVLHELATRDDDDVASMAEVRLKAAVQLRGAPDITPLGQGNMLAELNEMYTKMAPRIKSMRVTQIEFDDGPAPLIYPQPQQQPEPLQVLSSESP